MHTLCYNLSIFSFPHALYLSQFQINTKFPQKIVSGQSLVVNVSFLANSSDLSARGELLVTSTATSEPFVFPVHAFNGMLRYDVISEVSNTSTKRLFTSFECEIHGRTSYCSSSCSGGGGGGGGGGRSSRSSSSSSDSRSKCSTCGKS